MSARPMPAAAEGGEKVGAQPRSLEERSHAELQEMVRRMRRELGQALRQWSMYATDAGSDLDRDDHTEAQWYREARALLAEVPS